MTETQTTEISEYAMGLAPVIFARMQAALSDGKSDNEVDTAGAVLIQRAINYGVDRYDARA